MSRIRRSFYGMTLVFLGLASVYIFFLGLNHFFRYNVFQQEYARVYERYEQSLKQHDALSRRLAQLDQHAFWELEIRKRLGYVKDDEVVYKFVYEFE